MLNEKGVRIRTRIITFIMVVAMFFAPAAANAAKDKPSAHTTCTAEKLVTKYSANYHAVKKQHGARTPGRNIRKWGITANKPSNCKQIAKSLRTLRSMRHPGNYLLAGAKPNIPPAGTETLRVAPGSGLASIRQCESGGDYGARSGPYGGAYQFDQQTWNSVGGSGDPASAPPAEQDKRAAILQSQRGNAPWPVCGR